MLYKRYADLRAITLYRLETILFIYLFLMKVSHLSFYVSVGMQETSGFDWRESSMFI